MKTSSLPDTPLVKALRRLSAEQLAEELGEIQRQKAVLETHEAFVQLALKWKEAENGRSAAPAKSQQQQQQQQRAEPEQQPQQRSLIRRPSTREGLLAIMRQQPERHWSREELIEEMVARDWMPPAANARNQVNSRLGEMVARHNIFRDASGNYFLVAGGLG